MNWIPTEEQLGGAINSNYSDESEPWQISIQVSDSLSETVQILSLRVIEPLPNPEGEAIRYHLGVSPAAMSIDEAGVISWQDLILEEARDNVITIIVSLASGGEKGGK